MGDTSLAPLYSGSVKDVLGPAVTQGVPSVYFEYSDAYSVFDWGRMPDLLPHKGEALAILAADFFERLEDPAQWVEFSKSQEALGLRRGISQGALFNELGEVLQKQGLRTHYLGAVTDKGVCKLEACSKPFRRMAVRAMQVSKPKVSHVYGREVLDYTPVRSLSVPKMLPLEVVFRFSCPPGNSLVSRLQQDPGYWSHLITPKGSSPNQIMGGASTGFESPILEFFTKLEPTDRPVTMQEALAMSGVGAEILEELVFKTLWITGFLRWHCARHGLDLHDGKLEWALSESGLILADAIGPDELRLSKNGVSLSKECLRKVYRGTTWYEAVEQAKKEAKTRGLNDWKKLVISGPAKLKAPELDAVAQLYPMLTNVLTGKRWFPEAWSLEKVVQHYVG